MIKKGDKFLYMGILILFVAVPLAYKAIYAPPPEAEGLMVEIVSAGRLILEEPLNGSQTHGELRLKEGGGSNVLSFADGAVRMASADCRGGDCLRMRPIRAAGESIVCLPHRLIVRIRDRGGKRDGSGFDAIAY